MFYLFNFENFMIGFQGWKPIIDIFWLNSLFYIKISNFKEFVFFDFSLESNKRLKILFWVNIFYYSFEVKVFRTREVQK